MFYKLSIQIVIMENKYSLANKRRWSNPDYKKKVAIQISKALKGNKNSFGKHRSEETKDKIRNSEYHKNFCGLKGNKNYNWKGEHTKYNSIHGWVKNNFESKNKCEICGTDNKKLEWSNKDHKYSRNREDWQLICRSCHRGWDFGKNRQN